MMTAERTLKASRTRRWLLAPRFNTIVVVVAVAVGFVVGMLVQR